MNSHLKSVGKKFPIFIGTSLLLFVVYMGGCATSTKDDTGSTAARVNQQLGEVSLKEDRSQLDQYRKDVPHEKKSENDELALILNMTGEVKEKPERIRELFQNLTRKKREDFRKKSKKLRDDFTKQETKSRDEFLRKAKAERDDFVKSKPDKKELNEFFTEQERKRREFQADQKDKRQEFEEAMRAKNSEFEEYMRDKTKDFNEQMRLYSQRFQDRLKEERQKKEAEKKPAASSPVKGLNKSADLSEFEEMQGVPATRIGTDPNGN